MLVVSRPRHIPLLRHAYSTTTTTPPSPSLPKHPSASTKQSPKRPPPSPSPSTSKLKPSSHPTPTSPPPPKPKPVTKLTPPKKASILLRDKGAIEAKKEAERSKPLDDHAQIRDLERLVQRAKLRPGFELWNQPMATLDVHIPMRIFNPNKRFWEEPEETWEALRSNFANHIKNAMSLYRLVHENNVPGVYIPFAPFHYRLFVWTPRFFRVASVDTQVKEGVVEKAPRKRRKGFFSYVPFVYLGRAYYKVKWMMGLSPRTRKERTYEGEREMERQREKEMQKETTKKPDWMKGMRDIAEDTYKHVMDAIATGNIRKVKLLTTIPYQSSLSTRLTNLSSASASTTKSSSKSRHTLISPSPAFKWTFHGHHTPLRVLSLRTQEAYLDEEPPPDGASRLLIQALVRFDTLQSLEPPTQPTLLPSSVQGKKDPSNANNTGREPEAKRVVEYLVFEKRLFNVNAPWVIRDELFVEEGSVGKWD